MYLEVNVLQNPVFGLMVKTLINSGGPIIGYIDPNNMHHIFTFLVPILAFFTSGASLIVSAIFFLRRRSASWFRKVSRLKLIILCLILIAALTIVIAISYKFIVPVIMH